jgi:3',5'-cyclic AMP phosphodiesterase CpdA
MRRLAHISDLHFGKTDRAVVRALHEHLLAFEPHLVIVTGDVTQRARVGQFEKARAFLDGLPFERLVVPGNHDLTPVYRPLGRVLDPYRNYRRYIARELDCTFVDDELLVLGLNTAHPLRVTEGLVTRAQIAWLTAQVGAHQGRFRVFAAHHPVLGAPSRPLRRQVAGAPALLSALEQCGVELVLAGHLHESFNGPAAARLGATESMVVVQSSTTTSTRLRGHLNAYNQIIVDQPEVDIRVNVWNGAHFECERDFTYTRGAHAWELRRTVPKTPH